MKRIVPFLYSVVLLAFLSSFASGSTVEVVYTKDFLVILERPNESANGILGVIKGSELFVIGDKEHFYKVRTERGKVGWVNKEFVSKKVAIEGKIPKSREEINQLLAQYKGNEVISMAVEILDNGKFHVSIYNSSSEPFHVNPNHFTLINDISESLHYTNSEGIMVDLQPATKTNGTIEFKNYYRPKILVYSNPKTGRITRSLSGYE